MLYFVANCVSPALEDGDHHQSEIGLPPQLAMGIPGLRVISWALMAHCIWELLAGWTVRPLFLSDRACLARTLIPLLGSCTFQFPFVPYGFVSTFLVWQQWE